MDGAPLCQRDFIIGIEFERLSCEQAVREYEKRGVITFERSAESPYSKRMVEAFDSKGMVRVSPLHVHSPEEIERFFWSRRRLQECRWADGAPLCEETFIIKTSLVHGKWDVGRRCFLFPRTAIQADMPACPFGDFIDGFA